MHSENGNLPTLTNHELSNQVPMQILVPVNTTIPVIQNTSQQYLIPQFSTNLVQQQIISNDPIQPVLVNVLPNQYNLVENSCSTNQSVHSSQLEVINNASQGIDLDEIKSLVKAFKEKRVALGLTQNQVGQDLEGLTRIGSVIYSQSYICRIENLDFTPFQAQQLKPVLEKWLSIADEKYCYLNTGGSLVPLNYNKFVTGNAQASLNKKRQKRTVFTQEALEILNKEFQKDNSPNAHRMNELAELLTMDYKKIRVWFCNKRQNTKNN